MLEQAKTIGLKLRESVGVRVAIIGTLALLLPIPALMVQGLVRERELRRDGAVSEVSGKWGTAQTIGGPVLTVPFLRRHVDGKGKATYSRHIARFLPETLDIRGDIRGQTRSRGIYDIILYEGTVTLAGDLPVPAPGELRAEAADILWKDAYVSFGISDMKGIKEAVSLHLEGSPHSVEPGSEAGEVLGPGIRAILSRPPRGGMLPFSLTLALRGSESLLFLPLGKVTTARLASDWPSPAFSGDFLPADRTVRPGGFDASWKVLQLNRDYPQKWVDEDKNVQEANFGAEFHLPADGYQRTMRTAKYALLFITLTFLAFFLLEILGGKRIHPIQYLLVGLAIVLFYTLLLSLSEHLGFDPAYFAGAALTAGLVGFYARAVLGSPRLAFFVGGLLVVLYGFLFVVLQAEDFALLLGSLGLFVILALTMYLTRRVDWFNVLKREG